MSFVRYELGGNGSHRPPKEDKKPPSSTNDDTTPGYLKRDINTEPPWKWFRPKKS
jgi:hypothetical protein